MSNVSDLFGDFKLPTMPEVAHRLIRTLGNSDVEVAQVRDAIAMDPGLAAKLVRLANSARFGMQRKIGSIDDAITVIGMSQVRTLAVSACITDAFPIVLGLDRKAFWQSSLTCAGYARWLAGGVAEDAHQAWLTGFMLRLGELVMAQAVPGCLVQIECEPRTPGSRWQRELDLLGMSEGQVTAEMARRWNFPSEIVRGLATAARPMGASTFCRLGAVVHLAGLLSEIAPDSPEALDALPDEVIDALKADREWMRRRLPPADAFNETGAS